MPRKQHLSLLSSLLQILHCYQFLSRESFLPGTMPEVLAVRKVLTHSRTDLSILHWTEMRSVTEPNNLRSLAELTEINLKLSFWIASPTDFISYHINPLFPHILIAHWVTWLAFDCQIYWGIRESISRSNWKASHLLIHNFKRHKQGLDSSSHCHFYRLNSAPTDLCSLLWCYSPWHCNY